METRHKGQEGGSFRQGMAASGGKWRPGAMEGQTLAGKNGRKDTF